MSLSTLHASLLLMAGLALPSAVFAQTPAVAPDSGAAPASCVEVEVNGYRAPSYDCLSQQMTPHPRALHENPALASEGVARMPSNQLGLFNRAATANRMGSNFGNSAFPQRPAPIYTSPVAR